MSGEVMVSVKSVNGSTSNVEENEILIWSYFHNDEGLFLKVDGEPASKSVFMKAAIGSIERSSMSKMDKVMILKRPATEEQAENAKNGNHLVLIITVGDVDVSVELLGKGVLVQAARTSSGLARRMCAGSNRLPPLYTQFVIGAKEKGCDDFSLRDALTYLIDNNRIGNKNLVPLMFEHLTQKKIQQVREVRRSKKNKKITRIFRRKESDSSLEWDLLDDESYCLTNDSSYKDCFDHDSKGENPMKSFRTPSPSRELNDNNSPVYSCTAYQPPSPIWYSSGIQRRSPSPPRTTVRRSPSPPRATYRRSPSPPKATYRRSPSPVRFSFGGGRSSPCGGGRSSPCGGGGGGGWGGGDD